MWSLDFLFFYILEPELYYKTPSSTGKSVPPLPPGVTTPLYIHYRGLFSLKYLEPASVFAHLLFVNPRTKFEILTTHF
jgi:hypothetical protein